MTLRVRLLLGLVVLAAIGLTVAGGVTYHEQQTFLSKRVNEQLTSALAVAAAVLVGASATATGNGHDVARSLPFGTYAEVRSPTARSRPRQHRHRCRHRTKPDPPGDRHARSDLHGAPSAATGSLARRSVRFDSSRSDHAAGDARRRDPARAT